MNIIIPISSAISNLSEINSTQNYYGNNYPHFTHSQLIGIIVGTIAFFLTFIFLMFLIIYQKYRIKVKKTHAHSLNSNNPCYTNGSLNDFETNINHAHCNMSVLTDFYDIDDLNSLDNDSFLNSLENAIFVGYLNHNRPTYSVDHSISRMTNNSLASSNQPIYQRRERTRPVSVKRPSRESTRQSSVRSSGHHHIRVKKSKRNSNVVDLDLCHERSRNKSESGCDITRSTSNLISTSNRCLTASNDSVCDSSRDSHQIVEIIDNFELDVETLRDPKTDKMESSTESRTSVNSSSAMMSSYLVENTTSTQALPDLVNSSLPKSTKRHKRVASTYSNQASSKDEYSLFTNSRSGQILDPLRAGQTFHFQNEDSDLPIQSRHEHQLSPNFGISNIGIFDYNVSR